MYGDYLVALRECGTFLLPRLGCSVLWLGLCGVSAEADDQKGDNPFGTLIIPRQYSAEGGASADAGVGDGEYIPVSQSPAMAVFSSSGNFSGSDPQGAESASSTTTYTTSFELNTSTGVLSGDFNATTTGTAIHTDPELPVTITETTAEVRVLFDVTGAPADVSINGSASVSAGADPCFAKSRVVIFPVPFLGDIPFDRNHEVTDGATQTGIDGMVTLEPGRYELRIETGGEAYFDDETDTGTRMMSSSLDLDITITPGSAETLFWQPTDGMFNEATNWQPVQAPGPGDLVIFDKDQTSVVQFGDDGTGRAFFERGNIIFTQGSFELTGGSPESLIVGNDAAGTASLELLTNHILTSPDATAGKRAGTNGRVTIGGIVGATWNVAGQLVLGDFGNGDVSLSTGAHLTAGEVLLGRQPGSTGKIVADAGGTSGSPSFMFTSMAVGVDGSGEVQVPHDSVMGGTLAVGLKANGDGLFEASGAMTSVVCETFTLAMNGTGTATVSEGAQFIMDADTSLAELGFGLDAFGDLLVMDCNSYFRTALLRVGLHGDGLVEVEAGGKVEATTVVVGAGAEGEGEVNVRGMCEGTPSQLVQNGPGESIIGFEGIGVMKIEDGGLVSMSLATLGAFGGSQGLVIVDNAQWNISGLLMAGGSTLKGGTPSVGTVILRNGAMVSAVGLNLAAGSGIYGSGTLMLGMSASNMIEGTIASGVHVQAPEAAKSTSAQSMRGRGHGVLTIDGDLEMIGGELEVSIGGTDMGAYDRIVVTGAVNLNGTRIRLVFTDSYGPAASTTLPLVSAGGGVTLANLILEFVGLADGFDFDISVLNDEVVFDALVDGTAMSAPSTDLNLDGFVDAVDVQLAINGALGLTSASQTDVNYDGMTNAIDVQLVINGALGI